MIHGIYFVEGLPGSGKTTYVKSLKERLTCGGTQVVLMEECEKNSLDLSRCAVLTRQQYESILEQLNVKAGDDKVYLARLYNILENQVLFSQNRVYLFYQSLFDDRYLKSLAMDLRKYEIYNGLSSFQEFRKLHLERWRAFGKSNIVSNAGNRVFLCDALLLQSPLFELIGFYELSEEEISTYILELIDSIHHLLPVVYYRYTENIPEAMHKVCSTRRAEKDRWEKGFYKWMEESPYCKKRNLHGFKGMCTFLAYRQQLEISILEKLRERCSISLINGEYENHAAKPKMA